MILTYHSVHSKVRNANTVNYLVFILQLLCLKLRGKLFVSLKNYDKEDKKHIVIRFDDVDKKTLNYVIPILRAFKAPAEFFVCESFVLSKEGVWADIADLQKVVQKGFRLQYHSKTHPDLTAITDLQVLEEEIRIPEFLKEIDNEGFEYFAYPYWVYNDNVIEIVKKNYKAALSGNGKSNYTNWAMDSIRIENGFKEVLLCL